MIYGYNKPLIKGSKISILGDFMVDNRLSKVFVSSVAALLLLSSVVFLAGTQAGASDDLQILDVYEPDGTPPPRLNTDYIYTVMWRNVGDEAYNAKVVLYTPGSNGACSTSNVEQETDVFSMAAGETGTVNLTVSFEENQLNSMDEACVTATVNEGDDDHSSYELMTVVEPESGDADLYTSFDMESDQAAANQEVNVVFEYGNDGQVSTQTPITIMAWFGNADDNEQYIIDPSPITFSYISPDPDDDEIPSERMEWQYTIPDVEDGLYTFKASIDTKGNNTEDPDDSNNVDIFDVCVGDCSLPDLRIKNTGPETLSSIPAVDPVAGNIISFTYVIENDGEGEARGTTSNPLVMFLEVMKCPAEDCSGQNWVKVNESLAIRPGIPGNGGVFDDDSFLRLNWSTSPQDTGFWNVRVVVDGYNSIEETNETNNQDYDSTWFRIKSGYIELKEQRPDLIVANIDEGDEVVYDNEVTTLKIAVTQSALADTVANGVKVYLKIDDPEGGSKNWFQIDEAKTVGLDDQTTFFEYEWTPATGILGSYGISAYVDRENEILEWKEDNNEFEGKVVTVYEKLPDLQINSVSISPLNDEGYAMVGVSSKITATIANLGVRNMTDNEGAKLEVTFYTSAPFTSKLATVEVDMALGMGESTDVSIPFIFAENAAYRFIIKVDEIQEISEGYGGPELNNEAIKNAYAVSSVDAHIGNMSLTLGEGPNYSGNPYSLSFDVGISNIPEGGTYRLHFSGLVDGTFGYGINLPLSFTNQSGSHPLGEGYSLNGSLAYIDFNSSYKMQKVVIPWTPDSRNIPGGIEKYMITVEVDSSINVNTTNDVASIKDIEMRDLNTNIKVESIKVTETDGSARISVSVYYERGPSQEAPDLEVQIEVHVYKSSDCSSGSCEGTPVDTLTMKTTDPIMKGDSKRVDFTWATKDGGYIFVVILDPNNLIAETDEVDNIVPSKEEKFGESNVANIDDEEEDGGLLPAPSLLAALAIFSMVALIRRRN